MFGLAGAHRSGKSTLAKDISKQTGIPYVNSSVTEQMKIAGYSGVQNLSLEERIEAQELLLEFYLEKLDAAPKPYITDRTPLDMVAYTLGELTMHNSSAELGKRYDQYCVSCIQATKSYFSHIFITRPLETYEVDPTKPPQNLGYQWMIQIMIEGSAAMLNAGTRVSTLLTSDHEVRVKSILERLQADLNELSQLKNSAPFN